MRTLATNDMSTIELRRPQSTTAASDTSLAESLHRRNETCAAWNRLIDFKLIEWARDPSQLEDDDLTAPAETVLRRAIDFACELRDDGRPAPESVVPTGVGGIAFSRRSGAVFEQFEVHADCSITFDRFEDCRLVESILVHVMD